MTVPPTSGGGGGRTPHNSNLNSHITQLKFFFGAFGNCDCLFDFLFVHGPRGGGLLDKGGVRVCAVVKMHGYQAIKQTILRKKWSDCWLTFTQGVNNQSRCGRTGRKVVRLHKGPSGSVSPFIACHERHVQTAKKRLVAKRRWRLIIWCQASLLQSDDVLSPGGWGSLFLLDSGRVGLGGNGQCMKNSPKQIVLW